MADGRLLVLDRDATTRALARKVAEALSLTCTLCETADSAVAALDRSAPELVLADVRAPGFPAEEFFSELAVLVPHAQFSIVSNDRAVAAEDALRLDAFGCISRPAHEDELRLLILRMKKAAHLSAEARFLRDRAGALGALERSAGCCGPMQNALRQVSCLKESNTPVLLLGEPGSGRTRIAKAIHFCGSRSGGPFSAIECDSMPAALVEAELFGASKGGLIERAASGTLYLHEADRLSRELLVAILQRLEQQPPEVRPRLIASARLTADSASARLATLPLLAVAIVHVPPLREHRGDIPALVHAFVQTIASGRQVQVSDAAMQSLTSHTWPGNLAELESCLRRALSLGSENEIAIHDLPPALQRRFEEAKPASPLGVLAATDLEELERETIQRVFEQTHGDKSLAGRMLGISRATLYRKLKRYDIGLHRPEQRAKAHGLHIVSDS